VFFIVVYCRVEFTISSIRRELSVMGWMIRLSLEYGGREDLQTAKCKTWRRLGEDFLDNSGIEGVMHG